MLRSVKDLRGYALLATDGEIGEVDDFLFHDDDWTIRYLVVDTGKWLPGRKVLITPSALGRPDWETGRFPVQLTRQAVENSPEIDLDRPVSRQREVELHTYYAWTPYWPSVEMGDVGPAFPPQLPDAEAPRGDPNLRSAAEVCGYRIHASDGEIGHVEDFIVEEGSWIIRYMVVDTRNWWPGKKVLTSPGWITGITWRERRVSVNLSRETIRNSPEYDPNTPVNLEYEDRLYDYYGRPKYWD